jgi:formylmethanofuran dehydrogenase subunit C
MTGVRLMLTLTLKDPPAVPLEAEVLSPDVLAGKSHADVRGLPVYLGKRQLRVDDVFDVEGDGSDVFDLRGDLRRVKWIGKGMTRGRVTVHGSAGMHVGAYMKGGAIEVHGDAGDWLGAEMSGGSIRVHGNAGAQTAAAYRGAVTGMSGGTILIDGAAGIELGMRMRRGLIAVRGPVRDFAGLQMKGGTIVLMSGAELRTGAWMLRGTILTLKPVKLLPTFAYCCQIRPTFLRVYERHLAAAGFVLPAGGTYQRYAGDAAVPGKGEVLVHED